MDLTSWRAKLEKVPRRSGGHRAAGEEQTAEIGPPAAPPPERRVRVTGLGAVCEATGRHTKVPRAREQRGEHLRIARPER